MAAVTIWIASVAQEATGTESPLLISIIISRCCAPSITSFGSCTAVLLVSLVDEWEHTTSTFWCPPMGWHTSCMLKFRRSIELWISDVWIEFMRLCKKTNLPWIVTDPEINAKLLEFETFYLYLPLIVCYNLSRWYRGYYTVARRYEFYVRVARAISHERAQRMSEILFLPREHKIHIFELTRNVLFIT